ncbi:hypothetical protein DPMN_067764 [Dreissena polymorpha]|uniref:Uncharacterized protein n=1 Tax=Dreissena polymorpha TaxID=45954 RepID=A0A9D4BTT2_DREPO|nr:hypothetical protein DPMN_067764 [Dreissena polymorpha]
MLSYIITGSQFLLAILLTSDKNIHSRQPPVHEENVKTRALSELSSDWPLSPNHEACACFVSWAPALHSYHFILFGTTPHSEGIVPPLPRKYSCPLLYF